MIAIRALGAVFVAVFYGFALMALAVAAGAVLAWEIIRLFWSLIRPTRA